MPESPFEPLPGFAWAVTRGFRAPLGACRFEEGDLLYDSPRGYELPWSEARSCVRFAMQVLSPSRAPTTRSDRDEASVFQDNWRQAAVQSLAEFPGGQATQVMTTQGRIYTTLWRGDPACLSASSAEPPLPRLARDLKPHLSAAAVWFRENHGRVDSRSSVFATAFDETSDLLDNKARRVGMGLHQAFGAHRLEATPAALGTPNAEAFVPTAKVVAFILAAPKTAIESVLKELLYAPSRERGTGDDRFRLEAHGSLLADEAPELPDGTHEPLLL
ncbi:MAG: hypothetical protein FJ087_18085 [Deltaproteobacteria bacterium]|nr:hypothetical protein [Deltaproteobacteria bacterium]